MSSFQFDGNLYEHLDSNFFNVIGVPQPLVLKSWLSKLEAEVEDDVNLAVVAQRIRAQTEAVSRGRGRPKKHRSEESAALAPSKLPDLDQKQDGLREEPQSDCDLGLNFNTTRNSSEDESSQNVEESKGNHEKNGFTCLLCNKTFKSQSTLKYHSRIHK